MQNFSGFHQILLALIVGGFCTTVLPHPGPDSALDRINHELELRPDDPSLYLARATVQAELLHFEQALADLDIAGALAEENAELHVSRGAILLAQGNAKPAIEILSIALTVDAQLPTALRVRALSLRAQAYQLDQQPGLALADWYSVLLASTDPSPSLYLQAAEAAAQTADHAASLDVIDQGLQHWPNDTTLVQEGIDLLWQQGLFDAAIQRLAAHADSASSRAYFWKAQLAEKLLLVNRKAQARVALEEADLILQQKGQLNRSQLKAQWEIRQQLSLLGGSPASDSSP